jgi:hypothetical protein
MVNREECLERAEPAQASPFHCLEILCMDIAGDSGSKSLNEQLICSKESRLEGIVSLDYIRQVCKSTVGRSDIRSEVFTY